MTQETIQAAANEYSHKVVAETIREFEKQTGEKITPSDDVYTKIEEYFQAGAEWMLSQVEKLKH